MSKEEKVKIERNVIDNIKNFILRNPRYGYKDHEEFIRDSLRLLLVRTEKVHEEGFL